MNFFLNIQNKPVKQKKIILFFVVGILMIFIFGIWFFQFKNSLEIKAQKQSGNLTPIFELTENVVDTYRNSTEKLEEIKEIFNENEQVI